MKFLITIFSVFFLIAFFTPVEKVTAEDQQVKISTAFEESHSEFIPEAQPLQLIAVEGLSQVQIDYLLRQDESPGIIEDCLYDNANLKGKSFYAYNKKDNLVTDRTCKYNSRNYFLAQHYRKPVLYPIRV